MSDKTRSEAAYRFIRRYLMKYHPDIAEVVNCESLTAEQIKEKEDKLVKWEEAK